LFFPGCASRPSTNVFFSPYSVSTPLSPIAQEVGQVVVLDRLSLSMCLWVGPSETTSKQKVGPLPILFPHYQINCDRMEKRILDSKAIASASKHFEKFYYSEVFTDIINNFSTGMLLYQVALLSNNNKLHCNHPVSVSDLYIPRIGPHIFLQQNRQPDPGNI
jgi:hypothetical protein